MLEYRREERGDIAIFFLSGAFGLEEMAELRGVFWACIHEGSIKKLILDLSMVPSLDCSAISLFVATKNVVAKKKGQLILVGINPTNYALLERTHLDHYFDIRADVAEALEERKPRARPRSRRPDAIGPVAELPLKAGASEAKGPKSLPRDAC